MTHGKKAPLWARLKATKKQLKAYKAQYNFLLEISKRRKEELKSLRAELEIYKQNYEWAMGEINARTDRETKLIGLLDDYVTKNVEQRKQIEELNAQHRTGMDGKRLSSAFKTISELHSQKSKRTPSELRETRP